MECLLPEPTRFLFQNKQLWLKLFLVDSLFLLTTKSSYVLNTTYTILKPRYPSRKSAEEYRTTVRFRTNCMNRVIHNCHAHYRPVLFVPDLFTIRAS